MTELQGMLREATQSVFRLETRSFYTAPGEADMLRAFNDGSPMPPRNPDTDPWLRMVADSVSAGRQWSRVHVLDRPLSDYLRFELLGYQGNVAAGEDVRIADRAVIPRALGQLSRDFWLLDNALAVVMEYDDDGRRLAMEPTRDVDSFVDQRDLAVKHSVPLVEYIPVVQAELGRSW
jgi:hypothetical protein